VPKSPELEQLLGEFPPSIMVNTKPLVLPAEFGVEWHGGEEQRERKPVVWEVNPGLLKH
jgi:hypothetical protein